MRPLEISNGKATEMMNCITNGLAMTDDSQVSFTATAQP
jgi:hypothetical protein